MVLLTMTASIVELLTKLDERNTDETAQEKIRSEEPSLAAPAIGNPISHGQIIDIRKMATAIGFKDYTLESLLQGACVYVPPPPPKPEQVC
jgi:TMEM199 family protein